MQKQCKLSNLRQKIDTKSGKVLDPQPGELKTGDACLVDLVPNEPVQVEVFSQFPMLGRFVIIDNDRIVGVGVIREVTYLT